MKPYLVGLTGGLASGKSTVAGWLRDAGLQVVDADQLVADLYRPRAAGAAAVRDLFGASVLNPEGGVDHRALADEVFGDPTARRALEQAIHPLVRRRFEEIAAAAGASAATGAPAATLPGQSPPQTPSGSAAPEGRPAPAPRPVVVLEATLLVEAGYAPGFDLIVTVEAAPEARLRRAVARGLRDDEARARLAAQGDGERRRQGAHRVLANDGDLAALRRQVDALLAEIADRAAHAAPAAPSGLAAAAPRP